MDGIEYLLSRGCSRTAWRRPCTRFDPRIRPRAYGSCTSPNGASRRLVRRTRVDEAIINNYSCTIPTGHSGRSCVEGRRPGARPVVAVSPSAHRLHGRRAFTTTSRSATWTTTRGVQRVQAGGCWYVTARSCFDGEQPTRASPRAAAVRLGHFRGGVRARGAGMLDDFIVAVACDDRRSRVDNGLAMLEAADLMVKQRQERDQPR